MHSFAGHCTSWYIAQDGVLLAVMVEEDIEIDLTTKDRDDADGQRALTDRERGLRSRFGYKRALVQPSQVLGTGSYGSVVKARLDNLPCAAKILHHTFFTSSDPNAVDFMQRFQLECRILRQLRHPCIVQFLGIIEDPRPRSNGRPILLMELMEGSLTQFLESSTKPLPYHTQVNITYDIALALDYLHANGILHRDLSSNNILLIGGTRAKLTDFGMSKMVDINPCMTRNKQTMCPGTLAFMPPEALLSKPIYSDKLDVFSCGVLMIQIITRKFPNPEDPHTIVNDPKYGRIQIPIPELERRKNDLLSVFLTHPLRQLALNCLSDADGDRPTASTLCQSLMELMSTPEYASSSFNSQQQVLALPPPQSAYDMRDTEIAVLDEQIRSFTQERDRIKSRGKKDTNQLDADIADLQQRKQPLSAERECQREEERKKAEYKNENVHLKKRVESVEAEKETAMSENADLKVCNAALEKERRAAELEQAELHQKNNELKQIVQSYLVLKPKEHDSPRERCSKKHTQLVPNRKLQV